MGNVKPKVTPKPPTPFQLYQIRAEKNEKRAQSKTVTSNLFYDGDTTVTPQTMIQRTFDDIGGTELIELVRTDSVSGVDQRYLPISGLADINNQFTTQQLLGVQAQDLNLTSYENTVNILTRLPNVGNGQAPNNLYEYLYVEDNPESINYNNLIINLVNLQETEKIEIEFITIDETFDDTIITI